MELSFGKTIKLDLISLFYETKLHKLDTNFHKSYSLEYFVNKMVDLKHSDEEVIEFI